MQEERDTLREELLSQKEPELEIWEIFSLPRMQKMLKLGDTTLLGKHALERRTSVWLDNVLLI